MLLTSTLFSPLLVVIITIIMKSHSGSSTMKHDMKKTKNMKQYNIQHIPNLTHENITSVVQKPVK